MRAFTPGTKLGSVAHSTGSKTIPHHTEHELAADGLLFANGFASGETFVFDVNAGASPKLVTHFAAPKPFNQPHSYTRLPNGHVLATLQSSGEDT